MELTYASYLHLDSLLQLQQPHSEPPEHDEMLFIIVHQSYELWFKLQLHEFDKLKVDFVENRIFEAIATLKRTRTIMKAMVEQLDIVETLTPLSFNSFRDRLESSSGFQSVQFRELEFLLGYKRREMISHLPPSSFGIERLGTRLREPSVMDAYYVFLEKNGATIPDEVRKRDVTLPTLENTDVAHQILRLYKNRPELRILFELMTDFDEGFQEWRYRHIKLVERTIGAKKGTGGSLGVEFLKNTLFHPIFPDLWSIRHEM